MAKNTTLVAISKIVLSKETRVRKQIGGVFREVPSNARQVIEPGVTFEAIPGERQKRDAFGDPVVGKDSRPVMEKFDVVEELLAKGAARRLDESEAPAPAKPQKPRGQALIPAIAEAMQLLDDDPEAKTADGKISVPALEKVLGYEITAADRDNAEKVLIDRVRAESGSGSGAAGVEASGGNSTTAPPSVPGLG